jgi:hypothetical protein
MRRFLAICKKVAGDELDDVADMVRYAMLTDRQTQEQPVYLGRRYGPIIRRWDLAGQGS